MADKKQHSKSDFQHSKNDLERVLYKISQCIDFQNLYAIEEEFNKIGMTIQTTSKNRMILCRLNEGKVVAEKVIDDYIFIGSLDSATVELSESQIQKISDFVRNHAGIPDKVRNIARVWRNGLRMYENIMLVNEEVNKIANDMNVLMG